MIYSMISDIMAQHSAEPNVLVHRDIRIFVYTHVTEESLYIFLRNSFDIDILDIDNN